MKALITGITGQDGSYLAELLLRKEYEVYGLVRRSSGSNLDRINHLLSNNRLTLVEGEVSDTLSVYSIIEEGQFDEVYNLAAMSHVGTSFKQPDFTFQVDALGPLYFLEAIRKYSPQTRFYQASTSELFGKNVGDDGFQDEETEFMPQSPYAVAKLAAHNLVRIYREGYGIHASAGILFNHESYRRGLNFVTKKITKWIADFYHWKSKNRYCSTDFMFAQNDIVHWPAGLELDNPDAFPKLRLGNIDASRDWGHAEDYVNAMYLMLQQEQPQDFVISTGETHSVREFLQEAFDEINIEDFDKYIVIDPKFYRPAEVEYLCGRSTRARDCLGWEPRYSFKDLVKTMVWSDIHGEEKTKSEVQQEGIF